jgi:hypothetical protein
MIDSPTKVWPLEVHSPNASNIFQNDDADAHPSPTNGPVKSPQRMKGSSLSQSTATPRLPSARGENDDEEGSNENNRRKYRNENDEFTFSPIVRHADLSSPSNMSVSADDCGTNAAHPFGDDHDVVANYSFPIDGDEINIQSLDIAIDEEEAEEEAEETRGDETEEERMQREIAESVALARQLMGKEWPSCGEDRTQHSNADIIEFSKTYPNSL